MGPTSGEDLKAEVECCFVSVLRASSNLSLKAQRRQRKIPNNIPNSMDCKQLARHIRLLQIESHAIPSCEFQGRRSLNNHRLLLKLLELFLASSDEKAVSCGTLKQFEQNFRLLAEKKL